MPINLPNVATPAAYDVDGISSAIAGENSARKCLQICNDGTVNVYIGLGCDAVIGQGTFLVAGAGTMELNWTNMNYGYVTAIADGSDLGHVTTNEW
jgi:hypothetical protein